jgi:hypothetical protein
LIDARIRQRWLQGIYQLSSRYLMKPSNKWSAAQFDQGARITLIFVILLIAGSVGQVAYRFTLPTDGWSVMSGGPTEAEDANWTYLRNLVGVPSPLQENDVVLAVEGQTVRDTASYDTLTSPPNWAAGQTVEMLILRDGQEMTVAVPVVRWTVAAWLRKNVTSPTGALYLLGALIFAAIGFFTFFKRPELPSARALLVLSVAYLCPSITSTLPDGLSTAFDPLAFYLVVFYGYAIFGTLLAPSLLAFTLHFPHTKPLIARNSWLGYLPVMWGLIIAIFVFVLDLGIVGWLGTMAAMALSILSLFHSGFTQRDAVSRAQLRWAIGGFVLGLGLALLTFPSAFGWVDDPFWAALLGSGVNLGFPVIGLSLAMAILRYRLFDIDVIIRRTLVYSILTALLALTYFGLVTLSQSLTQQMLAERSPLVIVISTLVIAALFTPLRQRVQAFVDRRFYRQKYDAQHTLDAFAATLRDEVDLDRMTGELIAVVEKTVQPEQVGLWLQPMPPTRKEYSHD